MICGSVISARAKYFSNRNIQHFSNNLRRLKTTSMLLHDIRNWPTTYYRHRSGSRDVVVLIRSTINNVPPSATSTIYPRSRWSLLCFAKTRDNMRAVLAEASRRETHARFIVFHGCFPLCKWPDGNEKKRDRKEEPFSVRVLATDINHRQEVRDVILILLVNFAQTYSLSHKRHLALISLKKKKIKKTTYINMYLMYQCIAYAPIIIRYLLQIITINVG